MAAYRVRVKGATELERAFRQVRKEVLSELRPALRQIGELVRADAQARFQPYDTASAAGYKVRVRARGVAVEQSKKRTTGLRPDYGALQMRRALVPALDDKESEVLARVELLVNRSADRAGF